mmetsp:Transcript_11027/g.15173  ORF Transcript_11027/g.15173 Transcript_11027/m.15173 type:complete len:239 (+) Transcript_11027:192-908(+)
MILSITISIFTQPPEDLKYLFENNRQWVKRCLASNPNFFKNMIPRQKPRFLLIGCADSRVPAQEILGLKAGEIFVHRNVANLVVNGDMNFLSVLQYAVEVLEVQDIIVLGHYGCGGVKAASSIEFDHGLMEHWLRNIRDVIFSNIDELNSYDDDEEKHHRIVELSVREQCLNLYRNPIVQQRQLANGGRFPRVHGMVYDIRDGLLSELKVDFAKELERNRLIYGVVKRPPVIPDYPTK